MTVFFQVANHSAVPGSTSGCKAVMVNSQNKVSILTFDEKKLRCQTNWFCQNKPIMVYIFISAAYKFVAMLDSCGLELVKLRLWRNGSVGELPKLQSPVHLDFENCRIRTFREPVLQVMIVFRHLLH